MPPLGTVYVTSVLYEPSSAYVWVAWIPQLLVPVSNVPPLLVGVPSPQLIVGFEILLQGAAIVSTDPMNCRPSVPAIDAAVPAIAGATPNASATTTTIPAAILRP